MEKIVLNDLTLADAGPALSETPEREYAEDQIGPGSSVTLHFEVSLPGGEVIDSNFSGPPATFTVGDGNLLPGFERAIFGMREGQESTLRLEPEQAFGERNEDNIQTFPRYRFPADLALEKGLMINFADASGYEQAGVVTEFDSAQVVVDFNHPLAGRDISFRVSILAVSR